MRYADPQLLQQLAAEYVLGTLQGRARLRFERLMAELHQARAAVWGWEQRLSPLSQAAGSVPPRPRVWRAIVKRTSGAADEPRWYQRAGLWGGLSFAATAAAVVLAVILVQRLPDVAEPRYVAVFNDERAQPLWIVSADLDRDRLTIRPINATAPDAGKSFELWILPAGGAAPRSMGLLPIGSATVDTQLPTTLRALLEDAQGLAVSLEPAGGSPTGAPTGPVLYQAAVITL